MVAGAGIGVLTAWPAPGAVSPGLWRGSGLPSPLPGRALEAKEKWQGPAVLPPRLIHLYGLVLGAGVRSGEWVRQGVQTCRACLWTDSSRSFGQLGRWWESHSDSNLVSFPPSL